MEGVVGQAAHIATGGIDDVKLVISCSVASKDDLLAVGRKIGGFIVRPDSRGALGASDFPQVFSGRMDNKKIKMAF